MTSFVQLDQPSQHPGVARAELVLDRLRQARRNFDGARGVAALVLGAIVAAVLVVADRLVVDMTDGNMLAGWVVVWGLAFVALALLADSARSLALRGVALWKRVAARRADAQFLAHARTDPRIMQELQVALTRHQAQQEQAASAAATAELSSAAPDVAPRPARTSYNY